MRCGGKNGTSGWGKGVQNEDTDRMRRYTRRMEGGRDYRYSHDQKSGVKSIRTENGGNK